MSNRGENFNRVRQTLYNFVHKLSNIKKMVKNIVLEFTQDNGLDLILTKPGTMNTPS